MRGSFDPFHEKLFSFSKQPFRVSRSWFVVREFTYFIKFSIYFSCVVVARSILDWKNSNHFSNFQIDIEEKLINNSITWKNVLFLVSDRLCRLNFLFFFQGFEK